MQLYKSKFIKLIVFVVAFQILNMSIDVPSAQADNNASTGFNYIDTYAEYVTEVLMKFENAIPESGQHQQKELQQHKFFPVIQEMHFATLLQQFISSEKIYLDNHEEYAFQFIKEINSPPKFSCC